MKIIEISIEQFLHIRDDIDLVMKFVKGNRFQLIPENDKWTIIRSDWKKAFRINLEFDEGIKIIKNNISKTENFYGVIHDKNSEVKTFIFKSNE